MNGKKKKQLTLGSWIGFKNLVEHGGKKVEVEIPTVVTVTGVTCDICNEEFINTQGLGCHRLKCETSHNVLHESTVGQTPPSFVKPSNFTESSQRDPDVFVE